MARECHREIGDQLIRCTGGTQLVKESVGKIRDVLGKSHSEPPTDA